MRYYIIYYSIHCGEYVFETHTMIIIPKWAHIGTSVNKHFLNWYPGGERIDEDNYQYFKGEIGIKITNWLKLNREDLRVMQKLHLD